jgi:RND family efflux transporter MFP subunit
MSQSEQNEPKQPSPPPAISGRRIVLLLVVLLIVAAVIAIGGIIPRVRARTALADQTNALAAPVVIAVPPRSGVPSEEVVLPGNIQAFTDSPIYARSSGYLKNSKRYQDLLKADAVSKQDTDNFTTQAIAGSSAVKSAQANVQRLQQLVDFEKIYAPFDGVFTARNVDIGQLVTAAGGTELFHMAALHTLRVYINVPQVYSRAATPGLTADLTFAEYQGQRFQGKIVRTAQQIDPVSRTLLVEVDISNRKEQLLPGAYTEVHLKLNANAPSYVVPVSALMFRAEGLRVGTVVDGNRARLIPIVIGHDDGREVQIISGLDADSQVIQDPPDSLVDGEVVRLGHIDGHGAASANSAPSGGQGAASGAPAGGAQK